jgi:hypothetical protein
MAEHLCTVRGCADPGCQRRAVTRDGPVLGTVAEIESWLRAVAAGRPWYPHPECGLCRDQLERAA